MGGRERVWAGAACTKCSVPALGLQEAGAHQHVVAAYAHVGAPVDRWAVDVLAQAKGAFEGGERRSLQPCPLQRGMPAQADADINDKGEGCIDIALGIAPERLPREREPVIVQPHQTVREAEAVGRRRLAPFGGGACMDIASALAPYRKQSKPQPERREQNPAITDRNSP